VERESDDVALQKTVKEILNLNSVVTVNLI